MTPQELKNSILQLAVQGKLVPQRPEEGSAEELLAAIRAEKQKLLKAGKIKKEKLLPEISDDEIPYELPANWRWERFGNLGSYKKGPFGSALTKSIFVPKGEQTIKVYEQKNAIQKNIAIGDYYVPNEYFETKMKGFEVFPGDIIVSCAGTIGETYVMPEHFERGIINQALMRMKIFEPLHIPYFLVFFDFVLKKNAQSGSKGSAIKNIPPFEVLKNYLVPLPPLAEQKRIVAKIEDLLPLCDRYGNAYNELQTLNKRVPGDLQKSLLQLAVQGKLVPQHPEEGSAEELLAAIRAQKQSSDSRSAVRKKKSSHKDTVTQSDVPADEIPFEIPKTWKWVRLGETITLLSGTDFRPEEYNDKKIGTLYITGASSLSSNGVLHNRWTKTPKIIANKGDILLVCKGSGYGKTVICDVKKAHIARQIMAIKKTETMEMSYLRYFLSSNFDLLKSKGQGVIPGIDRNSVLSLLFPLPPLAEQKRIVAKLEELLPLCNQLSHL